VAGTALLKELNPKGLALIRRVKKGDEKKKRKK
jgi:hypothetical protein